jgi:DNA-directed RNA polymerase alpha subunit
MALMEELLFDEGFRERGASSMERIRMAKNKREALLNERVIDAFTESLGFGICTFILHNAGIITVRDLILRSESELNKIPNIGAKKIAAIKSELADYGLSLKRSPLQARQLNLSL